jgi:hypothetical protein
MILNIKLRAGFFKTLSYCLTIGRRKIFLTPHDPDNEEYIIDEQELISVCIYKKSSQTGEIEITTKNCIYIGNFILQTNLEEVFHSFSKEFGDKIYYQ